MQEIYGTFIFVIFYKIVSDEHLYFSKEITINCLIIAASYIAARSIVNGATNQISFGGACLNPAFAIGIFGVSVISDPGASFAWFWIYWFMHVAGSLLAVVFYKFIYLKTQLMLDREGDKGETTLNDVKAAVNTDELEDD